jgi:hypothetical protein
MYKKITHAAAPVKRTAGAMDENPFLERVISLAVSVSLFMSRY